MVIGTLWKWGSRVALGVLSLAGAAHGQSLGERIRTASRNRMDGYGVEQGGTPAGMGERWASHKGGRVPVVSGSTLFGHSRKAALAGTVCFVKPNTVSLLRLERCIPQGRLFVDSLDVAQRYFSGFPGIAERYDWFAINYTGRFSVSAAGNYKFRLKTQGAAILWINGRQVVNNDDSRKAHNAMGSIPLAPGEHKIRVLYLMGERAPVTLRLFVTRPGSAERVWTARL
ncbi:MAG: PA14 domain-containing protein [Polyangiaceae bacterium]|nr:PA14 domain-containing protein [Polyangiaceae bacterium]